MNTIDENKTAAQNEETADPKVALYLRQKALLDTFLTNGAITERQYQKSLGDLTEKMGMQAYRTRKN